VKPRRCPSEAPIKNGVLFCSLSFGHAGKHEGYNKEWEDGEVLDGSKKAEPKPAPPKHDGPVWNAACQHCKVGFMIEVRPDQVTRNASVVVCPRCKQTGLYWFEDEPPSKFVKGLTERVSAEAFNVGLRKV
jgi:hypothetical protein